MKFLNFSSDAPNFRVEDGSMVWDVTPWTFGNELTEIGLSRCFINFEKISSYRSLILSCSLVDENFANWNGIIASGTTRGKSFSFQPAILEFWNLDCTRPRNIIFTLKGINAQNLNYVNIVLVVR